MGARRWVQISAWVAIAIYIAAECVSYYNVATTNEFWAAIEVGHYVALRGGCGWLLLPAYCCYLVMGT